MASSRRLNPFQHEVANYWHSWEWTDHCCRNRKNWKCKGGLELEQPPNFRALLNTQIMNTQKKRDHSCSPWACRGFTEHGAVLSGGCCCSGRLCSTHPSAHRGLSICAELSIPEVLGNELPCCPAQIPFHNYRFKKKKKVCDSEFGFSWPMGRAAVVCFCNYYSYPGSTLGI